MKKIPIKATILEAYVALISIVSFLPPFNVLRKQELDLYALILYHNNAYRAVDINLRGDVLSSRSIKKFIVSTLKISNASYANLKKSLKDKGFIENNVPVHLSKIDLTNGYSVIFDIAITKPETKED